MGHPVTTNQVYHAFSPKDPPAHTTLVAGLVLPEILVEIECTAMV